MTRSWSITVGYNSPSICRLFGSFVHKGMRNVTLADLNIDDVEIVNPGATRSIIVLPTEGPEAGSKVIKTLLALTNLAALRYLGEKYRRSDFGGVNR